MGLYERTTSESSDDIDIRPLELADLRRGLGEEEDTPSPRAVPSKKRTLQEEKHNARIVQNEHTSRFFSSIMGLQRKKGTTMQHSRSDLVKMAWRNAARKARAMGDPWEKFNLNAYRTERGKRHRFHALKKRWVVDEVLVKMETESFGRGAMRECFRMKKLSNFAKNNNWSRAHNYVAKRYMNADITRDTYFEDVRLQMDAKLWGEEYNRHNPPKKVDIFQMAILEMVDRPGSPLFHVEHFIEGKYVKYNSNSGFVRSEALRMTPQAFSHFSFERSGHELIVVDIQGVEDLYTDPQIHTSSGSDYGDGNLGTKGMALFFHSHICNSICRSLGLTQFDLAPSEIDGARNISNAQKSSRTVVRGTEEHVILPTAEEKENIQECIRLRSLSSGYLSADERERIDSIGSVDSVDSFDDFNPRVAGDSESEDSVVESVKRGIRVPRIRYDSISDFGENTETKENDLKSFNEMVKKKARPSHVYGEEDHQKMLTTLLEGIPSDEAEVEQRVLGMVHLDLAKYHELNRFVSENESYDREAAMFHLKHAADCNNLDAILAISQIYQGLPHDILPDIELDEDDKDSSIGFKYLKMGAEAGDRAAIVKIASAYDTGFGLPDYLSVDWWEAVRWYEKAVNLENTDRDGNFDGTMNDPIYQLLAREANLYWSGGNGLDKDPNKAGELFTAAADAATEAMKGKLASKYYMQAEEAWAECDE